MRSDIPTDARGGWYRRTEPSQLHVDDRSVRMTTTASATQCVRFTRDLLCPANELLASVVDDTPSLFVTTPTVDRLYGGALRTYLDRHGLRDCRVVVLDCDESSKRVEQVLRVCEHASAMRLARRARIVGVGGGVCTDVCGFAAAIYSRGVSHVKAPTTLLGLIDAGIGLKNGVNFAGRKSSIGTFHPPEYSLLDPSFVRTLDVRQIRSGMAESCKMALACDGELFAVLERHGPDLVASRFADSPDAADEIVRVSVIRMLEQLARNPFEVETYERAVDFGHTFSPYLESAGQFSLLHGEAVAVDMAISVCLARRLDLLSDADAERALDLLEAVGLLDPWPSFDVERLWGSLGHVEAHRNGALNLVVPTGIGTHTFVRRSADFGLAGLASAATELEERHGQVRRSAMVS